MFFFEKFKLQPQNFRKLEQSTQMNEKLLHKTKNAGAGIYWFSLLANTALIGFGLPKVLNKILRMNIDKEKQQTVKN